MLKYVYLSAVVILFTAGAYGQFPWNMVGFNPAMFSAQLNAQMQGLNAGLQNMNAGLQNMGANIQAMTQDIVANSLIQAHSSIADNIRRAQEAGTTFNFSDLRPGEFRRFTDREGNTRGFAFRSEDGQKISGSFFSGGQGSNYFFSTGTGGQQIITF